MTAALRLAEILLDSKPGSETLIFEATVHRPPRSSVWVAVYTGPVGGQVWRSTGLRDRDAALLVARKWEAEARAERAQLGVPRKSGIRVRRSSQSEPGELTQKEVAIILNLSERAVREIERRAFQKLRNHPLLKKVWQEYSGQIDEEDSRLTLAEIDAIFGLVHTAAERDALDKLLQLIQDR